MTMAEVILKIEIELKQIQTDFDWMNQFNAFSAISKKKKHSKKISEFYDSIQSIIISKCELLFFKNTEKDCVESSNFAKTKISNQIQNNFKS